MESYIPPPPPPPPEQKKKPGLAIGIIIAVVICLCLVVVGGAAAYIYYNPGWLLKLQGTAYTSPDGVISLYTPKDWVREDAYEGQVVFAPTREILENGITEGAGFLIMYTEKVNANLPENVDPDSPEDFLNYFMTENFSDIQVVEGIKAIKISGYPAASTVFTVADDYNDTTIQAQMAIAVTSNMYIIILYATPQEQWEQYESTLSNMQSTLKITDQ